MPSDVKWRKRQKRNDKEHHEKASFFHIAEFSNGFSFVSFLRKRLQQKVQVKFSDAALCRFSSK